MSAWPPIDRDDLRHAAGSAGFDTTFPLLIRRLVSETAVGLESVDMPGGSGTAAGGFDGVVEARGSSAFVPQGVSVWELSVGGGQTKANEDYAKRLEAPNDLSTVEVTYVQAILDPWTKARAWERKFSEENRWLAVRGYNLDRIHAWLDLAPATTVWLAGQLGKAMPGVRSVEAWWYESWLPSTRVPLGRSIVLAGREKAGKELISAISAGQQVISLGGDLRADEACAFLAAALEDASQLDREIGAHTLFVSDPTSLERLLAQPQSMLLLLSDPKLAKDLAPSPRHQLVILAPPGTPGDVTVPRVDGQITAAHLESAGLSGDEAGRLGVLGRRSLLGLRRGLAIHAALHTPSWASAPDSVMRRLLLLGSWSEAVEDDHRMVAACTGMTYEKVRARAEQLVSADDIPFLSRVDDVWHVLAFEDAWTLLAPSITRDDLAAFRAAINEVLGEADPVLEVQSGDRWKAGLNGVKRRFSRHIRGGLAETLALLGASEISIVGARGRTTTAFAQQAVHDLLHAAQSDESYRGWLSLTDVLGELAEAAPQEFLHAMAEGLTGDPPAHSAMFEDDDVDHFGLGPHSPHSPFLWALERLAWSPDYIDETTDILARLAEIDPGGRLLNRPLASLVGVLSAWSPNTAASTEDRIRCIRTISRRYPTVGAKLLAALIPDGNGIQTVHPGPRYRDWKRRELVTYDDLRQVVTAVVDLIIEQLGEDTERLAVAIDKVDNVSSAQREKICSRLIELSRHLDPEDSVTLYDALRDKVAHHREFSDSTWALPEVELRPLQEAFNALTPNDPVLKHSWLFRSDGVTLGDVKRRDDYSLYDAEVRRRRAAAIHEVVADGGIAAALRLAKGTERPGSVGFSLADISTDLDGTMLDQLAADGELERTVASGYLQNRLAVEGTSLRDALLARTDNTDTQARILRLTYDPIAAWERLNDLDPQVAEHYWRDFVYVGLGPDFASVLEAAWAMLGVGRAVATLDLMVLYMRRGSRDQEAADVIASALEMLLERGSRDPELPRLDGYHFEQLFPLLAEHREHLGNQRGSSQMRV